MPNSPAQDTELPFQPAPAAKFGKLIGNAPAMAEVFALAQKTATCNVTALITGETGTGKELLARAIHEHSPRARGPFVAFSCANLPETLIDDELFGHERGAFTGADGMRRGRFETANGGTLFLDEIGDLPLALQSRLLRVLQERTFHRLGGTSTVPVDIRLIAATHRDLEAMVREGTFRQDLLYRLNVVQLRMPALRDRRDDIPTLARHFLARFSSSFDKRVLHFSPGAQLGLTEYAWPGNVRELENTVQRAVALADNSTVEIEHLPEQVGGPITQRTEAADYDTEVREFKRRLIIRTLRACRGNKSEAARSLQLARPYLHRLIESLDIGSNAGEFREQGQHAA